MKTIGLIGGTSWQSTLEYYRLINQQVAEKLGGHHSAKIAMFSIDFSEAEFFINKNDFDGLARLITDAAISVQNAGAELLLICANTMHLTAEPVQKAISIPLIHIADATIVAIKEKGLNTIGLLGTQFTMEQNFYKERFIKQGIQILVPEQDDRVFIQQTIFNELFFGIKNPDSKLRFLRIIEDMEQKGSRGIILGCTEIPLLIQSVDVKIPLFDTTEIHVKAAVEYSIVS